MKQPLSVVTIFLCTFQIIFAQAPELKNMMPNSWQKLTRLSAQEEKSFFEKDEVRDAILSIDNYFFRKKKIEEMNYQVFTETNCGLRFYRFLISVSPLETIYNAEYKNKTINTVFGRSYFCKTRKMFYKIFVSDHIRSIGFLRENGKAIILMI